jgi:hypothetical protein
MPCAFYTAHFTRCSNTAWDGDYCGVHRAKAERLGARPAEDRCHCIRGGAWCGEPRLAGQEVCTYHAIRIANRVAAARRDQERMELEHRVIQEYLEGPIRRELQDWRAVARDCRRRMHLPREHAEFLPERVASMVARRFHIRTTNDPMHVFTDFWVNLWREENGLPPMGDDPLPAAPLPQGQMARLARDTQNVHTQVVAKQTNGNLELLLEEELAPTQDALRLLTGWWMCCTRPSFEDYWRVMEDVRHWYTARTCKKTNDRLYRRVLDGLLAKILLATEYEGKLGDDPKKDELFKELTQRLWEECSEAVGMCCEGHLARLANVLVGFDEAFKPPIPVGEVLQQRMAAIAEMKLSTKLKLQKAVAVMDELEIPVADRAPWLEALED